MTPSLDLPLLGFADPDHWAAWLAEHHAGPGIWLRLSKAVVPDPCLRYDAAVDVALRWGWIDGQKHRLDEREFRQRFTPRRPGSLWSRINTEKVEALVAAGKMQPPGLREVELAKADGRWAAAYSGSRGAEVPADLAAAFDSNPAAGSLFATLDGANRYAVLWRLQTAKTPTARASRLDRLVAMLARGETIHPRRPARQPSSTP